MMGLSTSKLVTAFASHYSCIALASLFAAADATVAAHDFCEDPDSVASARDAGSCEGVLAGNIDGIEDYMGFIQLRRPSSSPKEVVTFQMNALVVRAVAKVDAVEIEADRRTNPLLGAMDLSFTADGESRPASMGANATQWAFFMTVVIMCTLVASCGMCTQTVAVGGKHPEAQVQLRSHPDESSSDRDAARGSGARQHKGTITVLLLATFVTYTNDAMPMSYLPDAAVKFGLRESTVGYVIGAGSIPVVFCGGIVAMLSRQLGYGLVIAIGLATCSASSLMLGVVPLVAPRAEVVLLFFITARLVQGFGTAMVGVAATAAAGAFCEAERSWAIGMVNFGPGLAYVLGPMLGAGLYFLFDFASVNEFGALALVAVMWPVCRKIPAVEFREEKEEEKGVMEVAGSPHAALMLLVFLVGAGFSSVDATIEREYDAIDDNPGRRDVAFAGLSLCLLSFFYAVASPIAGSFASPQRFGARLVISAAFPFLAAGACAIGAAAVLTMPFGAHIVTLCLALALWGVGGAMVVVPATNFLATLPGSNALKLEDIAAWIFSTLNVGTIAGACLGAAWVDYFGFPAWCCVLAASSCVAGSLFVLLTRRTRA